MASFTLTGSGIQALSANVTALHVHVDTLAVGFGSGSANPTSYYQLGQLRLGDGTAWWRAWPIDAIDAWFGAFNGVSQLGYAIDPGGQVTVTEVIGGSFPFQGPSGASGASAFSGARVHATAVQTLVNNTVTPLTMGAADFDVGGYWNAGTPTRLTVPAGLGGKYLAAALVTLNSNSVNYSRLDLRLNGTTEIALSSSGAQAGGPRLSVVTLYQLAAGDYLEAQGFESSSGNVPTFLDTPAQPSMSLARLGA